jgi:hypothetical protein
MMKIVKSTLVASAVLTFAVAIAVEAPAGEVRSLHTTGVHFGKVVYPRERPRPPQFYGNTRGPSRGQINCDVRIC